MNTTEQTYSLIGITSMRTDLKNSLRGYTRVTPEILRTFTRYGFEIRRASTHYILTTHTSLYTDKGRDKTLVFTLSKTPSDYRTGLNIASTIYTSIMQALDAQNQREG